MSQMLRLKAEDLGKGLITAALAAVLAALVQAMNLPGFDFTTFNWNILWQVAVTAGLAYLAKNLLTDSQGTFLGRADSAARSV